MGTVFNDLKVLRLNQTGISLTRDCGLGVASLLQAYGARARRFNRVWLATLLVVVSAAVLAPLPASAQQRLLMLGDSLTAGYGLGAQDALPVKLQAALTRLGHRVEVLNAGVSGDTTQGGAARVGWALADRPTHAVVALGGNDGLRGLEPRVTRANLDRILQQLRTAGVPVLLAGMVAPPNLGREYGEEFNRLFPELAAQHQVALYPFILDGVAADPALNQADGIHPNARGVEVMVQRMLPQVLTLLGLQGS